ncbi:helix-turn-helix domain-containing protein [Cohnella cellulosilytica]|uniref:Helix-turn-helix domain-containing protein n=1 Tax=Cohnella cellulosilytica TaxID=986710 RepID=A0ABW2FK91_9BACL
MGKETPRDKIQAVILYMKRHLREKLTRDQLAEQAGLTPEHFSRVFKKRTGQSPVDYLIGIRVERAEELLRSTPLAIKEIARQVGFEDPYYFSRVFKKVTGAAPSDSPRRSVPRVVALDYYGHLRALGVEPVAIDAHVVGMQGELADWSAYTQDIGPSVEKGPDPDRLRSHRPELIVSHSEEHASALAEHGRVYVVKENEDPIYGQLTSLGGVLGREMEARRWLEAYERKLEGLRAAAGAYFREETVALLRVRAEVLQVYGNMIMGYPLYKALRLAPPHKLSKQFVINASYHSSVIEPEELPHYGADHLFVVVQPDEATRSLWERIRSTRIWAEYPAVRRGNVYELDVRRWLAYDPVSILSQAEEVAELALGRTNAAHKNPS